MISFYHRNRNDMDFEISDLRSFNRNNLEGCKAQGRGDDIRQQQKSTKKTPLQLAKQ